MKDKRLLIFAVFALLMGFGIHQAQEYRFYNLESVNLFLYDMTDIWDRLCSPGGLALVVSSFLTQFMRIPFAGVCIVTLLYLLIGWMTGKILYGLAGGPALTGLAFVPVTFLFLCLENDYYMFHGHVAFALAVAAVLAYASLPQGRPSLRYAAGLLVLPLLYHMAGSAALVYSVSIMVLEVLRRGLKGLFALINPACLLVLAIIYARVSLVDGWESALTPYMYYSNPSTYFFPFYAWSSLPLLMILARALSSVALKLSYAFAAVAAGFVLSFFVAWNLYDKVHSRSHYRLISEQYMAENGDWDEIINTADRRQPTFLVSYLDLALAQKGGLIQNYMKFRHQDLSSIMNPTPNLKAGFSLQSMVYESWNYHSAARQAAFDANMMTPGMCNPQQLKVLVRTNVALGAPAVAEKYIILLEKTLFYRTWARSMRSELENPSTPVLPDKDEHVRYDGLKGDMRDILQADPSQRILSQFYELYQILEKEGAR